MERENQIKIECDRCGIKTPHLKKGFAIEEDSAEIDIDGRRMKDVFECRHLFLQCEVCGQVSLQVCGEWDDEPAQLYPPVKDLSGVPEAIRSSYSEAKKVKNISPTAFLVLIRRALEYLCQDQGAVGDNLKAQIEDLGSKGIIPKTLSRMSQALRYFGNLGAHASDTTIGLTEAIMVEDFFLAVVEYVYIAPEKLKRAERHVKNKEAN